MLFNYPLEISIVAMVIAQVIKLPIQYIIERRWTPSIIFSTGGMPSSHSAFVSALTLSLALTEGVSSPYFAISFVFAGVIVHDSVGIRKEAGKHATVLNIMLDDLNQLLNQLSKGKEKDNSIVENKLKELLGHEPIEAIMGVLLGLTISILGYFIWLH